ncbi:hypothetical protein QCN29_06220 [Streptomyces sp. HNM0663]|uniref:Uncharacterized protein n=1 Tax=Streptomyces chengmaiensis TaxID=3040919 RepID=A0ABT6HIF9_9ACTN|nr:hypothetical protein [Streptomyces chengmaiensis]MDH2388386.1 hypothetical protein [Streptomyces chengmaiensis]
MAVIKQTLSHSDCDHENDRYARELCRLKHRHAECKHPITVRAAQLCDEFNAHHRECGHGGTFAEIKECRIVRRALERE